MKKTTIKSFPSINALIISIVIIGVISNTIISCNSDITKSLSKDQNKNSSNTDASISQNFEKNNILVLGITTGTDATALATLLNASILDTIQIGDETYIKIEGKNLSAETIEKLSVVKFAEKILLRHTFASPSDDRYKYQYAPQITNLESVWEHYTGDGIKVAVIDTGVNTLHEDFDGVSAFAEGYDFSADSIYTTTTNNDTDGHGTHVAGIIAARKNNVGIVGVAPDAIIIPYKAASDNNIFDHFDVATAITKAADTGADVINMSIGGFYFAYIEQDAVRYAISKGVSIVAAAGNEFYSYKVFPASYTGVIAVASSNARNEVSSYSTRGDFISVAGPGENILSLYIDSEESINSSYKILSGTSMSAPFVAGVVALLKQKFPAATPPQIKHILESTALDIGASGFDTASGHGIVRPDKALATTTLPIISWTEVEITLTLNTTTKLANQSVNIYDSSNTLVSYLYTGAAGTASAYFPAGTYTYTSNYKGDSGTADNGTNTFTVDTTKITLTHNFTTTN